MRYHDDDAAAAPVPGAVVRFSIFGDPAGSTLSRDQVMTDVNGIATVTLTAGQAEKSFRVAATAPNAPEADFDVSVSKFDFVELDAGLTWATPVTLRALLYDDKSCAQLPAVADAAAAGARAVEDECDDGDAAVREPVVGAVCARRTRRDRRRAAGRLRLRRRRRRAGAARLGVDSCRCRSPPWWRRRREATT